MIARMGSVSGSDVEDHERGLLGLDDVLRLEAVLDQARGIARVVQEL
jgi:hypothetical protein